MQTLSTKYPLKLRDVLMIPSLEKLILGFLGHEFPWPTQRAVEQFGMACGFSQNAVRTALTRAKQRGDLELIDDEKGIRLAAGPVMMAYTQLFLQEPFAPGSFCLLLFHFTTDQRLQRQQLREILEQFNFKMVTQNAYLRYGAQAQQIAQFLAEQGLEEHVYLFQDLPHLPNRLQQQLNSLYALDEWSQRLPQIEANFKTYLAAPGSLTSRYWRFLWARGAFHAQVLTQAPYLPLEYFPAGQHIRALYQVITSQSQNPEWLEAYPQSFSNPPEPITGV